jgi:hypothetical protein
VKPRSVFRCRRKRSGPWVGPVLQAVRGAGLKPETITRVNAYHAAPCPYPRGGGPCTCKPHEIDVEVVDPERN